MPPQFSSNSSNCITSSHSYKRFFQKSQDRANVIGILLLLMLPSLNLWFQAFSHSLRSARNSKVFKIKSAPPAGQIKVKWLKPLKSQDRANVIVIVLTVAVVEITIIEGLVPSVVVRDLGRRPNILIAKQDTSYFR